MVVKLVNISNLTVGFMVDIWYMEVATMVYKLTYNCG